MCYFKSSNRPDRLQHAILALALLGTLKTLTAADNDQVDGVKHPVISLDGNWNFSAKPSAEFWKNEVDPNDWSHMPVPGDIWAQGVEFSYDQPVAYKQQIDIPADFAGQRVILQFGAVHNLATLWANGHKIATHQGGFTPWECDITEWVTPGKSAWIALEVTDLSREISFNGKAQRPIGGITRSVQLRARPATYFHYPLVSTPFDDQFKNATLQVTGRVTRPNATGTASFRLFDPAGKEVSLHPNRIALDQESVTFKAPVQQPIHWDAEHPNLYRLEITITGEATATYSKRIGFRDIRFDKQNNLLINGQIVKLRGANRHVTNPTGGKVPTAQYERLDTELAKEANMNFFRTSHYPPGEGLLEQCDELGMYVTVESAIVDTGKADRLSKGMHDDPKATKYFLSQLEEMILNYGSHPATIIWSTANESVYGLNFLESYKLCKRLDPSRPVIASYQVKGDEKHESFEIKSEHYPAWNTDFSKVGFPTLYDEWIHVLGHNATEWFHDPSARDYWGRSLDKAWTKLFPTQGSIGGAIWNYIDDVNYLPDPLVTSETHKKPQRFVFPQKVRCFTPIPKGNVFGVARWGVIDEWRRKKPEFWNTKKAYSPVRLLQLEVGEFQAGKAIKLPVDNRFDHTDLSEVTLRITYNGQSQTLPCDPLKPHAQGTLTLPAMDWQAGSKLQVEFLDSAGRLIDIETIGIGHADLPQPATATAGAKIESNGDQIQILSDQGVFSINARTGLFESIAANGVREPFAGPYLHLFQLEEYLQKQPEDNQTRGNLATYDGPELQTWRLDKLTPEVKNGIATIQVHGHYGAIAADYSYTIGANGRLDLDYHFRNIPKLETPGKLREWGGPLTLEAGIKFQMSDTLDRLSWRRKGYWSYYPNDHLGALEGSIPLFTEAKPIYRQRPDQPWAMDVHDWFYQGVDVPAGKLLSNMAKAAKLGIYDYTLSDGASHAALSVFGNGANIAARFSRGADGSYYLCVLDTLDYQLRWGNYSAENRPKADRDGTVQLLWQRGK